MIIYKKELQETYVVENILCNKCGQSILEKCENYPEYAKMEASWGYDSKKDMTEFSAHICENCCDAYTDTFVIPVYGYEYVYDD